jgi:two-component system NtrC family sensor kinase
MRIVLVTADPIPALVEVLERLGHSVVVEADLVKAGRLLEHGPVEVLGVPAARLRAGAGWLEPLRARAGPGLLVLGLAGSLEEIAPLLSAGVDEYMVAPFAPAEVRGRMMLLAHRHATSAHSLFEGGRGEVARLTDIIQLQSGLLHAGLELQRVVQRICDQARALCHAEGAAVGMIDGDMLVYRIAAGMLEPFQGFHLPVAQSVTGTAVLRGEVLYSADTEVDGRANREAARHLGVRSMITVPLRHGERVVGALNIVSGQPCAFSEQDLRTMELLAAMLGASLANAAEFEAKQALASERAAALEALQESQALFASFMNNGPALAYMKDAEGRRVWANEPYRRFYRLEAAALAHVADRDLMPDEAVAHIRQRDREVFESGQPSATEAMIPAPDGTEHHWLTYRFIVRDAQGRRFLGAVSLDVTERKQMQARLVLSDRLVAMGTLAAGVAHEINQPLTFVISNLSFLVGELAALAGELPPGRLAEAEEVVREAGMGANKVRQIVGDLRMLSRVDDGVPTPVHLQEVLESALTIARAELRARATVVRDYEKVPAVEGSEGRLGQVFLNLLINAAQAIPAGQPERNEIRVRLHSAQGHVIVEVRDTGGGISPELRSRIFDPFFTTKPVGEGTGLGLFVCQGIIARFGGEISVESELGHGTTFRVIFPAVHTLEPGAHSEASGLPER